MKPGDKIEGPTRCRGSRLCVELRRVLDEGGRVPSKLCDGIMLDGTAPGALVYQIGATAFFRLRVAVLWCPFCGGPLTAETMAVDASRPGSPGSTWTPLRPDAKRERARVVDMLALELLSLHEGHRAEELADGWGTGDTVRELAVWVKARIDVAELSEGLRQDLGLAHLDACAHWLCKAVPCDGGADCNWMLEPAEGPAPSVCACGTST